MKCSEARPLLDPLCDGTLEARDSALVLDHLKSCDDCQHEWSDLEDLRARFQEAKNATCVPSGLMGRISDKLKTEERGQQAQSFKRFVSPALAIAAVVLIVGVVCVSSLKHNSASGESAETLVERLNSDQGVKPIGDRDELAKSVGYELKYLHLPQWTMQKSSVYTSNDHHAIARFDFVRGSATGEQHLSCYQAEEGVIKSANLAKESFSGKQVAFGRSGDMHYALWSQNGRDYLFVTPLPLQQLKQIVRDT